MRYQILLPTFVSLGVLGACADQPTSPTLGVQTPAPWAAAASATRTEFQGFIHPCGGAPLEEHVTPGQVQHLLASNRNQWVTGNSLVDGVEDNVARININLKTGTGGANVRSTITPDDVEGTWELRYRVDVIGVAPATARGTGHGTGELQGMTIKFTAQLAEAGDNLCNPAIPVVIPVSGVIIAPAVPG
jgi:hypothetical protein